MHQHKQSVWAKCVDLNNQGLAKVEHKPPICEEDRKKLSESTAFALNDPEKLQNKLVLKKCCTFVAEEGKISMNSRRLIFHSTQTAAEHAACAKQQMK